MHLRYTTFGLMKNCITYSKVGVVDERMHQQLAIVVYQESISKWAQLKDKLLCYLTVIYATLKSNTTIHFSQCFKVHLAP